MEDSYNPLPMTSALPGPTADTTRDTAREEAKCRHREGGREEGPLDAMSLAG